MTDHQEIHLGDRVPLALIEAEHIRRIIAITGSLDEAASVLKINRATLYRKRKRNAPKAELPADTAAPLQFATGEASSVADCNPTGESTNS